MRLLLQKERLDCRRGQLAFECFLVRFLSCVFTLLCRLKQRVIAATEAGLYIAPSAVKASGSCSADVLCVAVYKRQLCLKFLANSARVADSLTKNELMAGSLIFSPRSAKPFARSFGT